MTAKEQYSANLKAIKELIRIFKENKPANRKILNDFQGYGRLKEVLIDPYNDDLWGNKAMAKYRPDVKELYDTIKDFTKGNQVNFNRMIGSIKSSTMTAYYTPEPVIDSIVYNLINNHKQEGTIKILEPACGNGAFFKNILTTAEIANKDVKLFGIEKDSLSASIADKLYPEVTIQKSPLEMANVKHNSYDMVISNIPFGNLKIYDADYKKEIKGSARQLSEGKIHNYFFAKGMDLIKPGGTLAYITSTGVADSDKNDFIRQHLIKESTVLSAVRLPNNTFSEAGTKVNTDILIFQKRDTPLLSLDEDNLSELDKAFITTNEFTFDNITNKINGLFCDENNTLSKRVLGDPMLGYMHDKQIITIEPNENSLDINDLSFAIQNFIEADLKSNQVLQKNDIAQETFNLLADYIFNELWKGELTPEQEYDISYLIENLQIEDNTLTKNFFSENLATELNLSDDELSLLIQAKLLSITPEQLKAEKDNVIISTQQDLFSSAPVQTAKSLSPSRVKHIKTEPNKPENLTFVAEKWDQVKNYINEGDIFVLDDTPGIIDFSDDGPVLIPFVHKNPKEINRYKKGALISIAYKKLIHLETESFSKELVEEQREVLNVVYDDFVKEFGQLHDKKNNYFLKLAINKSELVGLEIKNENTNQLEKADIFSVSTFQSELDLVLSLEDAITKSLNKTGEISLDYISQITELSTDEIINQGLEKDLIYPNPAFGENIDFTKFSPDDNMKYDWVIKEDFLSGPIRHKITQLEKFGTSVYNSHTDKMLADISKLKEVDIPYLSIEEIAPKLGEAWIPLRVAEEFAEELFNTEVTLRKKAESHSFHLKTYGYSTILAEEYQVETLGRTKINGKDLFLYAMAGTKPTIKYTVKYSDGSKKSFLDKKAMTSANLKIDKINQSFSEYIKNDSQLSSTLENIYNNTQNLNVNKVFNGSHLTFPGLVGYEPYQHQKDAIWQNLKNDGGLNDHIVGAGKTLIMIATAMEMKRMGISNKTLITALKANTGEIAKDFKKAYPNSKVLCPKASDFTPAKRQAFFQKMANNDWDAVIMTHQQFGKIPQSREIQRKVLEQELKNIEDDLDAMLNDDTANKRQLKGLQTRKENRTAEIRRLSDSMDKDPNMLTFEKFGFGHIIVDESHEFKNLLYSTRFDRVAGLGPKDGSQMSLNMLFAIRTMQEMKGSDKGITFCSGTPISNSMVELYSIFKYLSPSELERRGMTNFDSWARTYANVSTEYELSVTNEVKAKERFREFNKVPELSNWYLSIANVANDDNIVLDKPLPNDIMVEIDPTDQQEEYSQEIITAIQTENFSHFGKDFTKDQLNAKMLIATNLASKMSLDVRSLNSNLSPEDGSKLLTVAKNIAADYDFSNEYKGTQLVFCDIETPTSKTAHIFNAYDALKEILINRYNIPEHEIAYIHNHDSTIKKKNALFAKVNSGEIRILLGSSRKMGVGVNVQERVIAMHHVTIPWTPHWVTQRTGRGSRQGNWAAKKYTNNTVKNYTYATGGTLDAYKYFIVDLKQKFIYQIKDGNIKQRNIDEGDIGSDGSMSPADFIARLSGKEEL